MKRKWMFAVSLVVTVAFAALPAVEAHATVGPGVLMGQPQKEHWGSGSVECSKGWNPACVDEISAGQFVAWPFIAEHTGTVEALFAVSDTGYNTGVEVGIYANRKYAYPEITFNAEWNSSGQKWTPANFMQYEAEIPPEDPGALLGTSGKVAESAIVNQGWTEFKLGAPVKVIKGEKYWLANTTFGAAGSTHVYQHFYHEHASASKDQPWGNYSNEPTNWATVARPLKELPSPETTKINCEKCNTEGWMQEEPRPFALVNPNREGQEEGGQTYSYAYGRIEEGPPLIAAAPAVAIGAESATLTATVNPNGVEVSECIFEYGTSAAYGLTAPCSPAPGAGAGPVAVSASVGALSANTPYYYRVSATNASGPSKGAEQTFTTLPATSTTTTTAPATPTATTTTATTTTATTTTESPATTTTTITTTTTPPTTTTATTTTTTTTTTAPSTTTTTTPSTTTTSTSTTTTSTSTTTPSTTTTSTATTTTTTTAPLTTTTTSPSTTTSASTTAPTTTTTSVTTSTATTTTTTTTSITTPSAPTSVTAAGATGQALVSWTAPASTGGGAITSYTVTPYLGASAQTPVVLAPGASSATIGGLSNGSSYTFTVTAANTAGSGPPSIASAAVIPRDTIFNFATPPTINSADPHAVELGVKFTASIGGYVTGIRFYKGSTNTGTHVGNLWSSSGTLLASATFTGETASGWQQVNFATPVAIAANTTYIAAYFAPKGDYSETLSGFASAGFSNLPLSALANSISVNGVYAYSATPVFPTSTYKSTNYWVDLDFEP